MYYVKQGYIFTIRSKQVSKYHLLSSLQFSPLIYSIKSVPYHEFMLDPIKKFIPVSILNILEFLYKMSFDIWWGKFFLLNSVLLFLALYSFIYTFELGYKIQQNLYLKFLENLSNLNMGFQFMDILKFFILCI